MATVVDICNLALSYLGDPATVAEIEPPEGSAQAEHCARFYPIARDSLLEMHTWGFATRRMKLAQLPNEWPQWQYAYAVPGDALNLIAVLPPDAPDDYAVAGYGSLHELPRFVSEMSGDVQVIMTNQAAAILRYTTAVNDPTLFTPLFVAALSWHLASMLAGPLIKGDAGAAQAQRCAAMVQTYLAKARESDAGQRRVQPMQHNVPWLCRR